MAEVGELLAAVAVVCLFVAKLIAGRAKDLDDARSLLRHPDLDPADVEALLAAVDRAFETDEHRERLDAVRRAPTGRSPP